MPTPLESIVTDGKYAPPMTHSPAACCSFVSRIVALRKAHRIGDAKEVERLINAPISFEEEFLSGDIVRVHDAIMALPEGEPTTTRYFTDEVTVWKFTPGERPKTRYHSNTDWVNSAFDDLDDFLPGPGRTREITAEEGEP